MIYEAQDTQQPWYALPKRPAHDEEAVHHQLFPHVQQLEEDQADIHLQNVLYSKLYTNREMMAFDWNSDYSTSFRPLNTNLENVIQSVCDTLVSRIGTNRPKASIIPRGGEFSTYLKARQLDRYLWGEFVFQKVHEKAERVFLDSCIYGTGFLKIGIDNGELYTERVNPDEIVVDQRECVSEDTPQTMHHRKLVSRLWALKAYGKNPTMRALIKQAGAKNFRYTSYRSPADDQIVIIESWKLPTRPGAGDGRHTICIENATLKDEAYDRDRFPFVWLKFGDPQTGFYGRSLVGDLTGYQIRLNELNEIIRIGQDLMCVPRLLVEQGSGIVAKQFDNTIAKILQYRGVKPEAATWQAFNAEIYNERDRIKAAAFEFAGISQLSSQAKLPSQARLDSSEALREFNAIEDQRFNKQAQAYESFFKEVASHLLELSAELYKGRKVDRKNCFRGRYLVQQIKWSEVDLEADKYVLEISASSIINMSPAARKDKLNEWLQLGAITMDEYKAWSGQPDLERATDLMGAAHDYIEHHIDQMLDGNPLTPDPHMNLSMGFAMVHDTYQHLRTLDTPEEVLENLTNWLELAKEEMQPTPTPQEQMAAAGGMGPEAMMEGGMPPEMAGLAMTPEGAAPPMPQMGPGMGPAGGPPMPGGPTGPVMA